MPYIRQHERTLVDKRLDALLECPFTEGTLNYVISRLAIEFIEAGGRKYSRINAAVGALECAKLELYRRLAVPYEDEKIAENGDLPYNVVTGGGNS